MVMSERQNQPPAATTALLQQQHTMPSTSTELYMQTSHMAVVYPQQAPGMSVPPPISPISQATLQSPLLRSHQLMTGYAVNAVRCFLKAIQLAEGLFFKHFSFFVKGSRLNDTLRLLMLWFDYGDRPEVYEQLRDSLKLIPSEVWLEVVPQLIARLVCFIVLINDGNNFS